MQVASDIMRSDERRTTLEPLSARGGTIAGAVLLATAILAVAMIGLTPLGARAEAEAIQTPADVQLHVGETTTLDGGALQVTLVQVEEDSRCPMKVLCVWTGRAVVRLHATVDGVDKGEVTASLYPGPQSQGPSEHDAVVDRYLISLVDVQPYPVAGQPQPLDQRVATLHVAVSAP